MQLSGAEGLRGWSAVLLLALVVQSLDFVSPTCESGVVNGTPQFAVLRDPYNANDFYSIEKFCHEQGFHESTPKSYTECYEHLLSSIPPFHVDLSKLGGCETDSLGVECDECNDCVGPLRLNVSSIGLEEVTYDSKTNEVHVSVSSELQWSDARLFRTRVSDIHKVWRPNMHMLVESVNETRGKQDKETTFHLHAKSSILKEQAAPVWDAELKAFDVKQSYLSCLDLDFADGTCDTSLVETCHVKERLKQGLVLKLAHALFDRYPFDSHILRIQLSFANPYAAIPKEVAAQWGISTPMIVDWGQNSELAEEWENPDGTEIMAHESLVKSLEELVVPGFATKTSLKLIPDSSGGKYQIDITIYRRANGTIFRYALPMIFMCFITTLVSWLGPTQLHPRNIVCIIGMLTSSTLANGAQGAAPNAPTQTTWFDSVFLTSILFSFVSLLENFLILWLHKRGHVITEESLDGMMRMVYPTLYLNVLVMVSVFQVTDVVGWRALPIAILALQILVSCRIIYDEIHEKRGKSELGTSLSLAQHS